MCHGPWFYRGVQDVLAEEGFESYAMDLLTMKEFKTIASLADDLEAAMQNLPVERPVIAGHSQGGLLTQKYMSHVDKRMPAEKRVRAVGLLGTGSLGHYVLSTRSVLNVYTALRAGGCSIPGLIDFMYMKGEAKLEGEECFESHMSAFCLPDSSTTNLTGVEISMREYYALMCASPGGMNGDGWPTSTHSMIDSRPPPLQVPSLVVNFEHDACYPRYHATYHAEYDGSQILDVEGQPHCWVTPGWDESFARPFAQWIAEETS
jgi:pimeloyl-ACP methyl ester carboxylesterase